MKVPKDQSNSYKSAGYGNGSVGFGNNAAILIVDFQKAFTRADSPLGGSELITSAVEKTKDLLAAARTANLPVIYTIVAFREDQQDMGLWPLKVSTLPMVKIGSVWAEIDDRLEVYEEDIILTKKMPSAFFNTDLINILIRKRVDTVILAGCTTSGCIRATAVDSFSYGFHTIIAEECVGDQAIGPQRANLFDINNRYGDVLLNQEILANIARNKGTVSYTP